MTFIEEIKAKLKKQHPDTKDASLDLYITQVSNIYKDVWGIDLNKQRSLKWGPGAVKSIQDYLHQRKLSDTTRANYYSALYEVMKAMEFGGYIMQTSVKTLRNRFKKKYDTIDDGLKSKKQEKNFMDAQILDDKIDEYDKQIKAGNLDKNTLQIWLILKLLKEFRFRNEIATLEFVNQNTYEKESKPSKRNMIVMAPGGWFISKNEYKTQKEYGELIIPLKGKFLKDIKFYHKQVGNGMLFKSSFQQGEGRNTTMTNLALTKYLTRWSNKNLPPTKDGSPRNLSTTMIVKIYASRTHGPGKAKIQKESKNRGNKPETMSKHYVSTKKPQ